MTGNTDFKALIVADLHLSDRYSGRHVDYLQNCFDAMEAITEAVEKHKVTHLFFLGDLIGMRDSTFKTRPVLLLIMKWLQRLNTITDGGVYSVRGNHDFGSELTDFEFLVSLGVIKVTSELDLGAVRYHFVDYGSELRAINLAENKYNVALAHANFQVDGVTTWFRASGGLELSSMENFAGIDMVISGHIHNPSQRMAQTSIGGKDISLYYPGSLTRPKKGDTWDKCFGIIIASDADNVNLSQEDFNLKPHTEIFALTYDDITGEEDDGVLDVPILNVEELSKILSELQTYNIGGASDYRSQIMRVAGLDKEAAELAVSYLEKVEGEKK